MDDQLLTIQELIDSATSSLKTARNMLSEFTGVADPTKLKHTAQASVQSSVPVSDGKIIEGIFDGQNMVDPEGQTYPVPANYASKSKLVEGDGMKLTITDEGKFVYKQINPVDRRMVGGVLIQEDGQYKILSEGKSYRVLLASVTFYRAEVGDQVTIILPKDDDAIWGAVENVMPKHVAETEAKAQIAKEVDGALMPDLDE